MKNLTLLSTLFPALQPALNNKFFEDSDRRYVFDFVVEKLKDVWEKYLNKDGTKKFTQDELIITAQKVKDSEVARTRLGGIIERIVGEMEDINIQISGCFNN
ncbi:MAG: hypothetical protein V4665_00095 [Patescibacteria group bacterium]